MVNSECKWLVINEYMKQTTANFKQRKAILPYVLGGIFLLFIVIMIGVYLIAKQANPIMLDEKGKPIETPKSSQSY